MNVYVYVYGNLTNTHGGTKRELRQWDNPHISVTPKTNRGYKHQIWQVLFPLKNQDLTRKKRPFLLLHMKGKLTRDTKISQTHLGVWGSRLDGWVSLPSQKPWTYPGVMGFFVDFTEMLRWVDIFFYSHEYQPTFNIGRWFQFQRSWKCWDKKLWECVKVFLNTLKMCKLPWKPVFTYLSAVFFSCFRNGEPTCAENMFCFPREISHVTAIFSRDFWWKKTAGVD